MSNPTFFASGKARNYQFDQKELEKIRQNYQSIQSSLKGHKNQGNPFLAPVPNHLAVEELEFLSELESNNVQISRLIQNLKGEIEEKKRQFRDPEKLLSALLEVEPDFRELILYTKHSIDQTNGLLDTVEILRAANGSMSQTISTQTQRIMSLEQEIWANHVRSQETIRQQQEEIDSLVSKLEENELENEEKQGCLDALQLHCQKVEIHAQNLQVAYEDCKEKLQLMELRAENTKGSQTEENEKELLAENLKELQEYIQEMERIHEENLKKSEIFHKDIEIFQKENEELRNESKRLKVELHSSQKEKRRLQEENEKGNEEIRRLVSENETLTREVQEFQKSMRSSPMGLRVDSSPLISEKRQANQEEEIRSLKKKLKTEEEKVKILGTVVKRLTLEAQEASEKNRAAEEDGNRNDTEKSETGFEFASKSALGANDD